MTNDQYLKLKTGDQVYTTIGRGQQRVKYELRSAFVREILQTPLGRLVTLHYQDGEESYLGPVERFFKTREEAINDEIEFFQNLITKTNSESMIKLIKDELQKYTNLRNIYGAWKENA